MSDRKSGSHSGDAGPATRLYRGDTPELSGDQAAVFDAYWDGDGVVCTPAGSGTGKTTTAIEAVAEAVVRELHRDPTRNPFESILVTTFTKDAARQLRTALKERLREHRRAAPPDDPVSRHWGQLLRWLDTASNVQTLDSFTQDLLREVAMEVGVAPSFGVADGIRRSDLLEGVFADLRADPDLSDAIDRLASVFPPGEDGPDWQDLVVDLHSACREFCLPVSEARGQLLRAVTEMHAGRRPDSFADVLAIVDELADYDPSFVTATASDRESWVEHARATYDASHRLAGDFGLVLAAFDEQYDQRSRATGTLSHTDITYLVREYLEGDPPGSRAGNGATNRRESWRESLEGRFRHVIVDEFQDTNFAQCRILAHLLAGDGRALLIGDLKQSIYEWRSAEPPLFADVIDYAAGRAEENVLDVEDIEAVPLAENFRSHPHLVRAANHVFSGIFEDPARGAIGTFDVAYDHLSAKRVETESRRAHVHALQLSDPEKSDGQSRREAMVQQEAHRVAGTLRRILEEGTLRVDRDPTITHDGEGNATESDSDEGALEPVRPGDVAILFRTKTHMRRYSRVLESYGIDNAVLGSHSLFREPEIDVVIDALAWVGRADETAARIADSPVAGLSDGAREYLAGHGYDLDRAIDRVEPESGDDQNHPIGPVDRRDLLALRRMRDDLQARRDGPKADLVCDLLTHSGFDLAALADRDGRQRYANLRKFVDTVAEWETDDPISYGEFMRRLERLRAGRVEDDTTLADVADMDSADTVKLLTAHTAKGLEFPVVVLADTAQNERYHKVCDEPFVADRRHGIALRPTTGGHEQPDGDAFPTFKGNWFHEDDSGFDFDRGLLWVSEIRADADGRIRHDHPMKPYVRDRRAEYWRVLYVAVTRASDHLVVPFPPPDRQGEWTSWAAALGEYLDPSPDGVLDTDDGPVPVGVDDITAAARPDATAPGLSDLLDGDPTDGYADDPDRQFLPRTVTATAAEQLRADPAGYQRSVLRGLGDVDATDAGRAAPSGVRDREAAPADEGAADGLDPDTWGDVVHETLAGIHGAPDPASAIDEPGSAIERALAGVDADEDTLDATRDRLRESILPAYAGTDTWERVREAGVVCAEMPLLARVFDGSVAGEGSGVENSPSPFLSGQVDLLYRDDAWRLVDVKTGRPPVGDPPAQYRTQLAAYAWLAAEVYGIEVVDARLLYLGERAESVSVDVDPPAFEATMREAVGGLWIDDEGKLRR